MGSGIAQVAATAGHEVVVVDRECEALVRGGQALTGSLSALVKRSRLSQGDADSIAARINWSTELADAASCDLVIEAIVERLDIKRGLFADLAALVGPAAVLASNTSSLSIAAMADGLPHPERFVGLHFFNPVPAMKLVEVVAGPATDPAIIERMTALMQRWGKHAVPVRDVPGFIVNRVARPYYAEAFLALDEGIDPATIDAALIGGGGFRMGPLTLADMIGHDINYAAASSVFDGMQPHTRFRPQPNQARLVEQGLLGRKTGKGVYDYSVEPAPLEAAVIQPAGEIDIAPDAGAFGWMLQSAHCRPNDRLAPGSISVDGVVMAYGDGRPLSQRADVDVLLDHAEDPAACPVLIATARNSRSAEAAGRLASRLGKRLVLLPDRPGQIVLRTLAQIANGAADAVEDGVAPAQSIDDAMIYGANYPKGPIAWARGFGLAEVARTLAHIASATGDALYTPSKGIEWL
ncbi:3-hydroxyacyl-CoA dehydrogenase NAD-binding domain-containing protein [Sphingomonas paucimobilis]|uniref:3-hydroxyacyl-CoA dehydrogenase NAD-binding domain-containing protein n=1 Tax=Sphingomonas paucimobilis TaxID=13689 RepID=UPI00223DAB06|nr:3-hydroxyacyl-CoA dehydrogenase NAD-binding domain-containing protein [Sphingomonas paucimobilis]